ncbi:uncharacterized protein LOC107398488 [Tribolium castaneum]|uniref:VWFC domain-containing protein n=1 Tax=Tribolium castaneum TaxID=7070 RepID=A0A139WD79_TRICA|nr:PREDICTED: uncharacterized protein LOC107398488 [Tribolium castaneum]KYB25862.1 hypothetical protein TcasGA2_TC034084 [Tribolium castaneum]|eukprot:XP_015838172.1 PREDICTED: uncharacterized protein LOC107398488 [Tribolium castaneum]
MISILVLYVLVQVFFASADDCDYLGVLLYEDLGCVPQYSEANTNSECPVKYSCEGLGPWYDYCHFRGNIYEFSQVVEKNLSLPSCDEGCFCSNFYTGYNFECAVLDCPEWFGEPIPEGCYRKYTLEHCCSIGETCPSFTDVTKCVIDGEEYLEGQDFYPQNTCLRCVCQEGFIGDLGPPFCKRISCGEQLKHAVFLQEICAPVYYQKSDEPFCCPNDWICANGSEVIRGEALSDEVCMFGEWTLKVGEWFKNRDEILCECLIPPLVTCHLFDKYDAL